MPDREDQFIFAIGPALSLNELERKVFLNRPHYCPNTGNELLVVQSIVIYGL